MIELADCLREVPQITMLLFYLVEKANTADNTDKKYHYFDVIS